MEIATVGTTSIFGIALGLAAVVLFKKYGIEAKEGDVIPADSDFYRVKIDLSSESIKLEILDLLSRPLSKLPVHADIPRLCHKMAITFNRAEVIVPIAEDAPLNAVLTMKIIRDILSLFAVALSLPQQTVDLMNSQFDCYFPSGRDYDISRAVLEFMQNIVGEDTKVIRLCKCLTQSMIAPSVIRLKRSFGSEYPYKDVRGQWRISINIDDSTGIQVIHTKQEQSFLDNSFQFHWRFMMHFDRNMDELREATIRIDSIRFGDEDNDKRKADIQRITMPFILGS